MLEASSTRHIVVWGHHEASRIQTLSDVELINGINLFMEDDILSFKAGLFGY